MTAVPKSVNPRAYYLGKPHLAIKPLLVASAFIPKNLVYHLMSQKKDAAISVKYRPGDAITNMEGMLHHFVTPMVPIIMHGDYAFYKNGPGHSIAALGTDKSGHQKGRVVIMSALVQQDFENTEIVWDLTKLGNYRLEGGPLRHDLEIPSAQLKGNTEARRDYDVALKRHVVYHLTAKRSLPSIHEVAAAQCLNIPQAISHLEKLILDPLTSDKDQTLVDLFVVVGHGPSRTCLSLELIGAIAKHQMCNELRALERMVSADQGYVYTWDPAAIFAAHLDATLLNRLIILGTRRAIAMCPPTKLRVFAFNDYADSKAVHLTRATFRHHPVTRPIPVVPKSELFPGPALSYNVSSYPNAQRAVLVTHNNSDAFGMNITTEAPGGSMDGSFGAYSSAAASLRREQDWSKIRII